MSTIHRVGLTIAGVVALLLMAGAFVVQGFTSAQAEAAQATDQQATASETPSVTPTAETTLEPQIIYVEPLPTPAPVKRTNVAPAVVVSQPQPAQATPPAPPQPTEPQATPPVIHIVVTAPPGHGDDNGGGDD